jgi:hypothetical protein
MIIIGLWITITHTDVLLHQFTPDQFPVLQEKEIYER